MQLVAHFEAAGGDRIEPRRERPQRTDEVFGRPRCGVGLQQVEQLPVAQRGGALLRVAVHESLEAGGVGARRVGFEHGPRQARDLAVIREPVAERALFAGVGDGRREVELQHVGDALRDEGGIAMPDAERVAGHVGEAVRGRRDLEVRDRVIACAPGDPLAGQHFRHDRCVARGNRGRRDRGSRIAQRRHKGEARRVGRRLQGLERVLERRFRPVGRRMFVVEVAIDPGPDGGCAERGQPLVGDPAGFAEFRVARVPEREHGVL